MAAEPVLLAVEEPKFCSLFCKVAASPLEVASFLQQLFQFEISSNSSCLSNTQSLSVSTRLKHKNDA